MPARSRSTIRVLVTCEHLTIAEALKAALSDAEGLRVSGIATDASGAIVETSKLQADVLLLDADMPDAFSVARSLSDGRKRPGLVVLSDYPDELTLARAAEAGAAAYLSKREPLATVERAIRAAADGEVLIDQNAARRAIIRLRHRRADEAEADSRVRRLTSREIEILEAIAEGEGAIGVAERLGISHHTVRTHTQNILTKLGVHSKLEALAMAIRHGRIRTNR